MESVWVFKLGLRSLMKSISNTKQSNLFWHFLKTTNWFFSKDCCCRELLRNANRLPNFCAQQCADEGVLLYTRFNLHHTDHMKSGKQRTACSQLTA